MTPIRTFARKYALTNGAKPSYARQLDILAKRLPWYMETVTSDDIDGYLTEALGHLKPITVNKHRRMIVSLVRAAREQGMATLVNRPVRKVKYTLPPVRAWSMEEMSRLLAVARQMPRGTRHCPYRLLLPAWIQVAFATGLRRCDLLAIEHHQIRGNRIAVSQEKTGHVHVAVLNESSLDSIASLPKRGPKVFGGLVSSVQIVRVIRRLVKCAGLCGTGKYLRRSSGTYAEILGIGATRQLGHRSKDMQRFYVDEVLMSEGMPAMPALN